MYGSFTLVDGGSGGQFNWEYGETDVTDYGIFYVQWMNKYDDDSYDLSQITTFEVLRAI